MDEDSEKRGKLADQIMHTLRALEKAWDKRDPEAFQEARLRVNAQEEILLEMDQKVRLKRELQLRLGLPPGTHPPATRG